MSAEVLEHFTRTHTRTHTNLHVNSSKRHSVGTTVGVSICVCVFVRVCIGSANAFAISQSVHMEGTLVSHISTHG